ncbi:hypothetical protein N9936_01275 [bacterium]|nr:hypothetical protein [bacterium]
MQLYKLPNNYETHKRCYAASYLQGFEHSNFVNLDDPITDADFEDWVVGLFAPDGSLLEVFDTLVKDELADLSYRFWFSFRISVDFVGGAYFAIYDRTDNAVKYQSNPVNVISPDDITKFSFVEARNSSAIDNINFDTFTGRINVFLDLDQAAFATESDRESYREVSTGVRRLRKTYRSKTVKLEAYFVDEGGFDALNSLCDFDELRVNNLSLTCKSVFAPEAIKESTVYKGEAEFYIDSYGSVNLRG